MKIYQRPGFLRAMKGLPAKEQEQVRQRARLAADVVGHPHLHSGVGLRPFGRYKEFRVGLRLRCLFLLEGGEMHLAMVGTHDEVARYVRNTG